MKRIFSFIDNNIDKLYIAAIAATIVGGIIMLWLFAAACDEAIGNYGLWPYGVALFKWGGIAVVAMTLLNQECRELLKKWLKK